MKSLYAKYLTEKTTDEIIESDVGFVSYAFLNDKQVYIKDIYVLPEFRQEHMAVLLANQVVAKAKMSGRSELIGTIVPSTKNSTDSCKVLLAYGMSLLSSSNDLVVFRKDI